MLLKGAERPVNWSIATRTHAPRQVGEFQHLPLTEDVTALGAVLSGRAAPPAGGRTVFDSSGIALQDLACAEAVLDAAAAAGLVQAVDL